MTFDQKNLRAAIILFVLALLIYIPSLRGQFTNWDDQVHVTENSDIFTLSPSSLQKIFSGTVNRNYQPLSQLSFAIEYRIFGLNPFVFHLNNMLLHAMVVVLIFWFAIRLGLSLRPAFVGALLFAVHPLHVESVAWITERKDVLYSFFYLLALHVYLSVSVSSSGKAAQRAQLFRWVPYAAALVFGVLSMLAKPMAFSLPLVLLAVDWFNHRRDYARMMIEKIPFVFLIAPLAWITYSGNEHHMIFNRDLLEGVLILVWSFTFYLIKFFWPVELAPIYDLPQPVSLANPSYLLALSVLVILAGAVFYWRRNRLFIFALLFFCCSIAAVLRADELPFMKSLVNDRFMYLPSMGICFWLGSVVDRWLGYAKQRGVAFERAALLVLIIFFSTVSVRTMDQIRIWHDSITLWNYIIDHTRDRYFAYGNRGRAYLALKEYDLALKDLNRALELNPMDPKVFFSRGSVFYERGDFQMAVKDFDRALELDPKHSGAGMKKAMALEQLADHDAALESINKTIAQEPESCNLYARSRIYRQQGEIALALSDLNHAIERNPNYIEAYVDRGAMLTTIGQHEKALKDFDRAISIDRKNFEAFYNRGLTRLTLKQFSAALEDFNAAIRINPSIFQVYNNRGLAYKNLGKYDQALKDYNKSLELNPRNATSYINRGMIRSLYGQTELTLEDYGRALSLDPRMAEGYINRAVTLLKAGRGAEALADVDRAIVLNSKIPMFYFLRGEVYLYLSRPQEALADYSRAIAMDQNFSDARLRRDQLLKSLK